MSVTNEKENRAIGKQQKEKGYNEKSIKSTKTRGFHPGPLRG